MEYSDNLSQFLIKNSRKSTKYFNDFSLNGLKQLHQQIFAPKDPDGLSRYNNLADNDKLIIQQNNGGNFRPSDVWTKPRFTKYLPYGYQTAYSTLTDDEINFAKSVLNKNQVSNLKDLPFEQKIDRLTGLYHELDYLHPFYDGNSRTIRSFIGKLAKNIDVNINWKGIERDKFYMARDINNLNKLTERGTLGEYPEHLLKKIVYSLEDLRGIDVKPLNILILENSKEINLSSSLDKLKETNKKSLILPTQSNQHQKQPGKSLEQDNGFEYER